MRRIPIESNRWAIAMIDKKKYGSVQRHLQDCLENVFDDVMVQIGDDIHYRGTNIVVTSRVFEGLLPEQRYHHVVRAVPKDYYEKHLQSGVVWFELAPGETGADLMKMPRASDIAPEQDAIRKQLVEIGFSERFEAAIESGAGPASITHFKITRKTLAAAGLDDTHITRACLFMILRGAYCDAHILADVLPKLSSENAA